MVCAVKTNRVLAAWFLGSQMLLGACLAQVRPVGPGWTDATAISPDYLAEVDDATRPALDPGRASTVPTQAFAPQSAATRPEASSAAAGHFPSIGGTFGLEEFAQHFAPYEPMYFVGGWRAPQIKFQISIRYRLLTPNGPLVTKYPLLGGFNFAYSQTSFWDWSDPNQPFFYDSSYRPEFFYFLENVPRLQLPPGWQFGAQVGVGHESNGRKNPDHRSLNIVFLRPIFTISDRSSSLFFTFAPKIYGYIGDIALNPDMPRYRGYADYRFVMGLRDGLQLAIVGRAGNHLDRGSGQFDLTYPLTKLLNGNADLSIDAQYFIGYGESLLSYNRRSQAFRIGFALVR